MKLRQNCIFQPNIKGNVNTDGAQTEIVKSDRSVQPICGKVV